MASITIDLQAFMADNDPGSARSRFEVLNQRHLRFTPLEVGPYPAQTWSLDDASLIGHGSIADDHLQMIFCISLSLQAWLFLHSPIIVSRISSLTIEPRPQVSGVTLGMSGYVITVDEDSFAAAAAGLGRGLTMGGDRGKMVRGAIRAYWDAVQSVRLRPRFLNLWAALELVINATGKRARGPELDRKISRATHISPKKNIAPLRELNNKLKHGKARPAAAMEEPVLFVGSESSRLKRLVDRAFAQRLGFSLSPSYENILARKMAAVLPGGNQPASTGALSTKKLDS